MKTCSHCKRVKPFSEFYKRTPPKLGYQHWCRSCLVVSRLRLMKSLKEKILDRLGRKCVGKFCRWASEDGTLGCTHPDLLHIDHVKNDGKDKKDHYQTNFSAYFRRLIALPEQELKENFQVLCPNCNWLKRLEHLDAARAEKESQYALDPSYERLKKVECRYCHEPFEQKESVHKYCSRSCKARAWLNLSPDSEARKAHRLDLERKRTAKQKSQKQGI